MGGVRVMGRGREGDGKGCEMEFIWFRYLWMGLRSIRAASYCIDSLLLGECREIKLSP